jgi:hypothetical protein
MPLDADQTAELKQLIGVSRKRALNFGICLGSTPESTVLVLHRQRSSDVLMREAKKAGDTAKVACGTMETSGNVVTLTCPEAPPANLARATKQFLATVGVKAKVTILGANGETLDSDEDEEGEGTETTEEGPEAPDPYEEKWKLVEAQLTPLVARAASESKVADPSQLRAAWAYALENAREGDFAGALKVAIRVKASIDEGGGEGDPAKLAFKAAIKKLEPRVLAALKGRAGPFEKVRLVWEFAHGKADAAPPDFAAANKALAALVPLLDEADKALEANKGTADTPEGIREGTVDKRQKEIKTGKQILTELAGMNAALKLALIHQPDQADAVKALIAEIQKSVSTNDLDNANVAMFKLENIPYHARQHRDREAAKIVDEVKALGGEIGRQLALPPETAIVVRVQRVLTALPARIPQEAAKDDLSQARIVLRDLKAAIAEMKAEEPQIANAAALRAQAEREFKALQPALGAARLIHKVSPAFKEDRKAFQELDKEVGGHLHTHAWARALADMPLLEAAAKKMRRGGTCGAVVDADKIGLAPGGLAGEKRHGMDAARHKPRHRVADLRRLWRHDRHAVHLGGVERREGLGQKVRIVGVEVARLQADHVGGEGAVRLGDAVGDLVQEGIAGLRQKEQKAVAALAREIGGGEVALEADALDRLVHPAHGRLVDAGARVQHPVHRGKADLSRFRQILRRRPHQGLRCIAPDGAVLTFWKITVGKSIFLRCVPQKILALRCVPQIRILHATESRRKKANHDFWEEASDETQVSDDRRCGGALCRARLCRAG